MAGGGRSSARGGKTMSKRGSGSSERISGFTARESKEINQVEALFRETDFYKRNAEQAQRAYGTIYDTSDKLQKSGVFIDKMEYKIAEIANDINAPDFSIKQTNYVVKRMVKELGSDNPKWSPENVEREKAKKYFREHYNPNREQREITSSTYKRAQKRLQKKVDSWFKR